MDGRQNMFSRNGGLEYVENWRSDIITKELTGSFLYIYIPPPKCKGGEGELLKCIWIHTSNGNEKWYDVK